MTAVAVIASGHTQIIWLCASSLGATAQAAGLPWPLACRACSGPGFEEGLDAGDGDADRVIVADRDADRLGGRGTGCVPGLKRRGHRAAPLPPHPGSRPIPPRCRHRRQRNHATCVMACHADWREAGGQQLRGEGSECNAIGRSGPLREDGGLTGYGMATAVDVVPALQRSHARLPGGLWTRSCLRPGALIVPEITLDRAPAAARPRRGSRCGSAYAGRGHPCTS